MARRGAFLLAATSSLRVLETGNRNEGFVEQSLLSCVSSPALELLKNGTEGHHCLLLLLKPQLAEVLCEARVGPWCESCAAGGSRGDSKGSECLQGPRCGACSVVLGVGMTVHLGCIKKKKGMKGNLFSFLCLLVIVPLWAEGRGTRGISKSVRFQ